MTNYDSFGNLVDQVSTIVKDDGLNVLLNNAGISTRTTRLDHAKSEDISTVFETNAVAPVMLTKVSCLSALYRHRLYIYRELKFNQTYSHLKHSGMPAATEESFCRQ